MFEDLLITSRFISTSILSIAALVLDADLSSVAADFRPLAGFDALFLFSFGTVFLGLDFSSVSFTRPFLLVGRSNLVLTDFRAESCNV